MLSHTTRRSTVLKSLLRTQLRAFSSTPYTRDSKTAEEGEETMEQKVRRQVTEEEGVDYITKFPRRYGVKAEPEYPEFDSEVEDHIRVSKEMTFWPYLHATIIAVVIFFSIQAWLERKARLNKIFQEKFGIEL